MKTRREMLLIGSMASLAGLAVLAHTGRSAHHAGGYSEEQVQRGKKLVAFGA